MIDYQINDGSLMNLKEQLRLFAFDGKSSPDLEATFHFQQKFSKLERLVALLEGELDFHGENTGYASHNLHAFAAKFPPQLPRAFIRGLSVPGDVVLDPMMGSGTTIVEALLEKRQGIGLDLDPLALQLSQVKTMPVNLDKLRKAGYKVLSTANDLLSNDAEVIKQNLAQRFDKETKEFIDYWFLPTTQLELTALVLAIQDVAEHTIRRFLELTFSSVIVTKSGGVSLARDLAHSRPHRVEAKIPKGSLEQFSLRFRKNLASLAQIETSCPVPIPLAGDARSMPFADNAVDLIVTSPPYANAIDYMRAHKFSLVWLGSSVTDLSELRSKYIGSERIGNSLKASIKLPDRPENIIDELAKRDTKKAKILWVL